MKIPPIKSTAATTPTPHVPLPAPPIDLKPAKPAKRENTFSKSRDVRENRGARQMKSSVNSRSFPHTRQS